MAFDSLGLQHAMDPEAIEPSLLNDDDRIAPSGPRLCLPPEFGKPIQQPSDIAGRHHMLRHLLATGLQRGDQPFRVAQFQ